MVGKDIKGLLGGKDNPIRNPHDFAKLLTKEEPHSPLLGMLKKIFFIPLLFFFLFILFLIKFRSLLNMIFIISTIVLILLIIATIFFRNQLTSQTFSKYIKFYIFFLFLFFTVYIASSFFDAIKIAISGIFSSIQLILVISIILLAILAIKIPAFRPLFLFVLIVSLTLLFFYTFMPKTTSRIIERQSYMMTETFGSIYERFLVFLGFSEEVEKNLPTSKRNPEETGGIYISSIFSQYDPDNTYPTFVEGQNIVFLGYIEGKGFLNSPIEAQLRCYVRKNNRFLFEGTIEPQTIIVPPQLNVKESFSCTIPNQNLDKGSYTLVVEALFNSTTTAKTYVRIVDKKFISMSLPLMSQWLSQPSLEEARSSQYNPYGVFYPVELSQPYDSGGPATISISTPAVVIPQTNSMRDSWITVGIKERNLYSSSGKARGMINEIKRAFLYLPKSLTIKGCTIEARQEGNNPHINKYRILEFEQGVLWKTFTCSLELSNAAGNYFRTENYPDPVKVEEITVKIDYSFITDKSINFYYDTTETT